MKRFFIGGFLVFAYHLNAQVNNHFNVTFGYGVSYFFNDKSLNRHLDNTQLLGLNYSISNRSQILRFCPGLHLQFLDYHSEMSDARLVHVSQNLLGLDLDVLMKLNKFSLLRVGLFVNKTTHSSISISQKLYGQGGYFAYGNSEIEKGYSQTNWQTGFSLGLSIPFKLFKREQKFNIKLVHTASPIVEYDYVLSKTLVGEETKVLSVKARPTQIIFGFDLSLKRVKKKKDLLPQD